MDTSAHGSPPRAEPSPTPEHSGDTPPPPRRRPRHGRNQPRTRPPDRPARSSRSAPTSSTRATRPTSGAPPWGRPTTSPTTSLSARVRFTPGSTEAELVFDDAGGTLACSGATRRRRRRRRLRPFGPATSSTSTPAIAPTAETPEYGVLWRVLVDTVTSTSPAKNRRRIRVKASGPWEQLDRWASPQVWTTAGSVYTRAALFSRVANRAGIPVSQDSVPYGPSTTWSAYLPSLALAAGETGRSAMRRLLSPVADVAAPDASDGGLRLRSWEDPRWRALMTRLVPLRWWRLHQPAGAVAVFDEIAGALLSARGSGAVTLGIDGPLVDQPTLSARFDGNSALGDSALVVLADNEPWSLVAFVRVEQPARLRRQQPRDHRLQRRHRRRSRRRLRHGRHADDRLHRPHHGRRDHRRRAPRPASPSTPGIS